MGYVIKFGGHTIYHSGDTLWFDGMADLSNLLMLTWHCCPSTAMIPARRCGNLDCCEAAQLGKEIGAHCVIPCHYDMFTFNTANPEDFAKACESIEQPYKILRGGEAFYSNSFKTSVNV